MQKEELLNKIIKGDSWDLVKQLPDEFIDCVVTSPPYWGLRNYGVEGQAGLEKHPQEWVDKMVELCELLRPKLKKTGTMWWNIGETYGGERWSNTPSSTGKSRPCSDVLIKKPFNGNWLQPKQLLGLPWRFAISMQERGWILRNACIWSKPNHMPSSVKDRFSNGYEHVFMFVKNQTYWFDLDAVREPYKGILNRPDWLKQRKVKVEHRKTESDNYGGGLMERYLENPSLWNSLGKNCGDVWTITTKPHPFAHFACFPEELAERCIKAGCPSQVCNKCGKPRERIIEVEHNKTATRGQQRYSNASIANPQQDTNGGFPRAQVKLVEWSDCGCNEGFSGGVVLDTFMGSGTVAVVAKNLSRQYLGFELNENYIKIAERRLAGVTDWDIIKDVDDGVQKVL